MSEPSSRHLSHDFAAWKGLSLRELFVIVMTTTPVTTLVFMLLGWVVGYPVACGCVGLIVGFVLAITVWPKSISRLKADKPYGYVMKQVIQLLVRLRLKNSPWINYQGCWRKSNAIGVIDV